jgi:hypothetical protein
MKSQLWPPFNLAILRSVSYDVTSIENADINNRNIVIYNQDLSKHWVYWCLLNSR